MDDEELLKPNRELLAMLGAQIATLEAEIVEKIRRYRDVDEGYTNELWRNFHLAVEPIRRQREAILKAITDFYALRPLQLLWQIEGGK